ncbi:hypothetical protein BD560DRAFT_410146 [Blakeslea trispora]|nr:hypothetical protein BD560DRAFT_410146 [Blakeslea trispora]
MSNHKSTRSVDTNSPIPTQSHSPDKPYYSLDAFYATLLSKTFKSNTEAIVFCRDLCSNHGFTVKQEQSTHKNIYVYCSREGLPDSHRNPKVNPQRNRQSQRCECRWRIVLFENSKETWEFRKSQNSDAYIHNHPLLKPEEIKKEWPREVSEKIFELARQRLPTNEIRQQVREQYPDISWDDRRFYNRLSEERQKMKQRDTALRTIRLVNLSAQICMVNAGSEDLSHYVESKLMSLLQDTCKFANVDSSSFPTPIPLPFHPSGSNSDPATPSSVSSPFSVSYEDIDHHLKKASNLIKGDHQKRDQDSSSTGSPSRQDETFDLNDVKKSGSMQKKPLDTVPKGFLAVPIPDHTFYVKMYSQNSVGDIRRAIFDMQRPTVNTNVANINNAYALPSHRRRSRAAFTSDDDPDSMDFDSPARKLSRQVASNLMDDELDDLSTQSSPSNSQTMLFGTATNTPGTHDMHHQQLMNTQFQNRMSTPSASSTEANLFYSNSNENANRNMSDANTNYIQSPSFSTQADHLYPSANMNTSQPRPPQPSHVSQQMMYDPSNFVQHQPQDINLMSSPSTPQQVSHERPHSMTFNAVLPMRSQSVSISRMPSMENQPLMRPVGYSSTFSQFQNMIDENEAGKHRYYSTYKDHLQQATNPLPPRSASTTTIPTSNASSSQMIQHYLPSQPPTGTDVFSSYQLSSGQTSPSAQPQPSPHTVFPNTYIASEHPMKHPKENQQHPYSLGYPHHQQQVHEQQAYRRASGPN